MGNNIFKAPDYDGTAQQMADTLPDGRAWGLKNELGSNIRALIQSLSVAHNLTQQQIELLDDEFRISGTFDLLEDWEESVGIPDECIALSSTIAERRQAVIDRLRRTPIVTLADMQSYVDALFPGLGVVLYPGYDYYTFEYTFEVPFLGDVSDKFILVAEVPLSAATAYFEFDFEITFEGGVNLERLRCLLEKIIPANVYLIIEEIEV